MESKDYVICARIIHIPLKRFDFTGESLYKDIPMYDNATQKPIEKNLYYDEAISKIRDIPINFRTAGKITGSIKRLVDLTKNIPADQDIDVMVYYVYYSGDNPEDSYPVAKQRLFYQRTNGRLIIFNRGVNENIGFWDQFGG